jgi:DNA-binding protein WhiA
VTREFQPTERTLGELSRMPTVLPRCCLLAEIGAALRISGTVCPRSGQTAVEADFAGYPQAARLRAAITAVLGYRPLLQVLHDDGPKRVKADAGPRYLLVAGTGRDAEHLILAAGLAGPTGRPLAGMPRPVVVGRRCDCAAGWRGAFLAAGALCSPQQRARPLLTVACPSRETALALVGTARRMGIAAHLREYRGTCHAAVAGPDGITRLLTEIGSPATAREWLTRWDDCQARAAASPAALRSQGELDGSNLTRSRQAAADSTMRARRALEILGGDTPGHLQYLARLRINHPEAQLSQLGMMADPPLSKDTIAGRLRRLNALADARAAEGGSPGTKEALPGLAAAS